MNEQGYKLGHFSWTTAEKYALSLLGRILEKVKGKEGFLINCANA